MSQVKVHFVSITSIAVLVGVLSADLAVSPMVLANESSSNPPQIPTDTQNAHWQHLVRDDEMLAQSGGGEVNAGMSRLGAVGYELFIVTTSNPQGAAGFHFFRRSPWIQPVQRPRFEHQRLSQSEIGDLAEGLFDDGLIALERVGWRLVAITHTEGGGVGWYYFSRDLTDGPPPLD